MSVARNYRTEFGGIFSALFLTACSASWALDLPVIDASGLSAPATLGVAYSATVKASNSGAKFAASGLPKGLSINSKTGAVTGIPVIGGVFWVTLSASNTAGGASALALLTVNGGTGTAVLPALPTSLSVGVPIDLHLSIPGKTPITLTLAGLPPGVQLINGTEIKGTPTVGGVYWLTSAVSNSAGTVTKNSALTVSGATSAPALPAIAPQNVDASFDLLLTATGKTPITFSVSGLPPGVAVSGGNEVKTNGTLGKGGVYWAVVTAKNSVGTATAYVSLSVGGGQGIPVLASIAPSQTGAVGQTYNQLILATGATPMTFTVSGLPPGLNVVDGARIAGIPTMIGTYIVSITASNAAGPAPAVTYTLVIGPGNGAPLIARPGGSDPSLSFHFGDKVAVTLLAAGQGTLTYAFGPLPAGITASGGSLKGNCYATEGTYSVPVTVTNAAGSDTRTLTIYSIALPFSGSMSFTDSYTTTLVNDPDFGPSAIGNSVIGATLTINLNGNAIEFDDAALFDITIGNYSEQFFLGDVTVGTNQYTLPYTFTTDAGKDIPLGALTVTLNTSVSNPTLTITVALKESDAYDFPQNFYVDNYLDDDPPVAISLTDTVVVDLGATTWNFNITASGAAPVHKDVTVGTGDNATDLELISASAKGSGPLVP